MTSWIRVAPAKRPEQVPGFFFETAEAGGFCSNFNQFLYAYLYAKAEGKPLSVYDMANPVGVTFPLIKSTFVDISGIAFTDSAMPFAVSLKRSLPRIQQNALNTPIATMRQVAQQLFQWNDAILEPLKDVIKEAKLPASFDLGIHIRVGDGIIPRAVSIDEYVRAAKKILAPLLAEKDEMNVFVMSDSSSAIEQFKKKADKAWKVYAIAAPAARQDIRATQRARQAVYYNMMAQLLVMQSIPNIVCTFSSNVGRFLYLTVEHADKVVSLDVPRFSATVV